MPRSDLTGLGGKAGLEEEHDKLNTERSDFEVELSNGALAG